MSVSGCGLVGVLTVLMGMMWSLSRVVSLVV